MSSPHVVARGLGKSFSEKRVLDSLSLAVEPGDVVGVLGKNGTGKTTLLELMLGFTPASTGNVTIFGHDSYRMPANVKSRVGFVPQQDELLSPLSAGDQLRVIASFYSQWDDALIQRLCAAWGVDVKARVRSMSVGERQKLSILLALGHRPDLLILDEPHGRLKLFLSALITVALVAIPAPLLDAIAQYLLMPRPMADSFTFSQTVRIGLQIFGWIFPTTLLAVSWLYVAIYFVTSDRSVLGLAKCLLVVIALIYVPSQRIVALDPQFTWTALECVLTWAAFAAWLFLIPYFRHGTAFRGVTRRFARRTETDRHASGHEFEWLLGTARPWLLALAMLFPVAIQTLVGFRLPNTWLFYLTLFSAISGGLAGRAAERSRSIWLRARWSREELFSHVEAAFWKHNSFALVLLLVLLVAVVRYYELPRRVIPLGIPLLVLGMVLSTYLGLMMTKGLRWFESTLAIAVILALMGVAVLAADEASNMRTVVALEVMFALSAITLRFVARHRWHHIDWMLCRADRGDAALSAQN
jgi:ABC-type Na+ transport system ATPase subunit NatA